MYSIWFTVLQPQRKSWCCFSASALSVQTCRLYVCWRERTPSSPSNGLGLLTGNSLALNAMTGFHNFLPAQLWWAAFEYALCLHWTLFLVIMLNIYPRYVAKTDWNKVMDHTWIQIQSHPGSNLIPPKRWVIVNNLFVHVYPCNQNRLQVLCGSF